MQMPKLGDIWTDVKAEKRAILIMTASAVLLTVAWYQGYYTTFLAHLEQAYGMSPKILWMSHALQFASDILLMLLVPFILIKFVLKENLSDFGVRLGDWKFGLKYLAVICPLMLPFLYMGARNPAFIAEYPLMREWYGAGAFNPFIWEFTYVVYYIAWEFHFRGFLQLGMEKRVGPAIAISIQTLVSALIHVRKPFDETFSAIMGGWLIGIVAWRSRSIIWGILLHWYIGAMTDYFCWVNLMASQVK
jgi:membrane protease YdiL (CAAX protease family)